MFPQLEVTAVHSEKFLWIPALIVALVCAGCATTPSAQAPATATAAAPAAIAIDPALAALVASPARAPAFVVRDVARHPAEELSFFGLKPTMAVLELWPAPGYWTEILGPYLAAKGHYHVANQTPGNKVEDAAVARWAVRVEAQKDRLGNIVQSQLGNGQYDIAPPDSMDLVLTFRNLHNWLKGGYADAVLAACFKALKPGGILGIEDHRGSNERPQDPKAESGYVRQDYAIALAERAGFQFVGSSEINANPKDTKDYPDGVWTLPPVLSQGEKDRARYLAIGEADHFTLKFRKPAR